MKVFEIIILLIILYIIWQKQELKKFKVTVYQTQSEKINGALRFAVVADLHAHVYGKDNAVLFQKIKQQNPDFILVPGDMIVSKYTETYEVAYHAFEELVKIAPVYFSYGNHESRVSKVLVRQTEDYLAYEEEVKKLGVHFLNNATETIKVRGEEIQIQGLEIPLECYEKGTYEPLPANFIEKALGKQEKGLFQILMAHNPLYADDYAKWGADISVCGHTHGGLVRFPVIGSILSPQLKTFPKYDGGAYEIEGKKIYVSKGLGTHTFHIRILDRAEVLVVYINI